MASLVPARNFYSVKEISVIIGFHPDTVYEWIQSKGMPVHRSGTRGRIAVYWPEFKNVEIDNYKSIIFPFTLIFSFFL